MEWALFDGLALESVERILAAAGRVRLLRGEILFHEGDRGESVYLIETGKVAVRISTPEGDLVTVACSVQVRPWENWPSSVTMSAGRPQCRRSSQWSP